MDVAADVLIGAAGVLAEQRNDCSVDLVHMRASELLVRNVSVLRCAVDTADHCTRDYDSRDSHSPRSQRSDVMPVHGIDHLELFVGNAAQAAYYYTRAFGFTETAYRGLETGHPRPRLPCAAAGPDPARADRHA